MQQLSFVTKHNMQIFWVSHFQATKKTVKLLYFVIINNILFNLLCVWILSEGTGRYSLFNRSKKYRFPLWSSCQLVPMSKQQVLTVPTDSHWIYFNSDYFTDAHIFCTSSLKKQIYALHSSFIIVILFFLSNYSAGKQNKTKQKQTTSQTKLWVISPAEYTEHISLENLDPSICFSINSYLERE